MCASHGCGRTLQTALPRAGVGVVSEIVLHPGHPSPSRDQLSQLLLHEGQKLSFICCSDDCANYLLGKATALERAHNQPVCILQLVQPSKPVRGRQAITAHLTREFGEACHHSLYLVTMSNVGESDPGSVPPPPPGPDFRRRRMCPAVLRGGFFMRPYQPAYEQMEQLSEHS